MLKSSHTLQKRWILLTLLLVMVSPSTADIRNQKLPQQGSPASSLARQIELDFPSTSFLDMLMLGLAGIPVYRAVGLMLPFLRRRSDPNNKIDSGRVYKDYKKRSKRSLSYAKELLDLLISVETALEKHGITEPQCQLRATCEIHRRGANDVRSGGYERNFIKLVGEMRHQIANPRVIPMAKYVFEFYEEAAERGETRCNCKEAYPRCPHSVDFFMKRTKGRQRGSRRNM